MTKKFKQWLSESLRTGTPVDFFKKIHDYSKNPPVNMQTEITNSLVLNDVEDVSHENMPVEDENDNK